MDGQYLLPNTVLPSKFDGLNFDGLAGKRQNRQNFPLYGMQKECRRAYNSYMYKMIHEPYENGKKKNFFVM